MTDKELLATVEEHLAEIVDGEAPEQLYNKLAENDEIRDLRYEGERAVARIREAGADYRLPKDYEARLLSALDGRPKSRDVAPPPGISKGWLIVGGASLTALGALAASLAFWAMPGGSSPIPGVQGGSAWQAKVSELSTLGGDGKLEVCDAQGTRCAPLRKGDSAGPDALLRTDPRARARLALSDGSELSLDYDTQLLLNGKSSRRAQLLKGAVVADIAHKPGDQVRFDLPLGHLDVLGTKFGLRIRERTNTVEVSRGQVRLVDLHDRSVEVRAAEQGRITGELAPEVTSTLLLAEGLSWSDPAASHPESESAARGLGELRAKKPGEQEERKNAVRLTSHRIKVRISGSVARTEVEESFANSSTEVLEGIYRFPLPPDAQIERLALEVDGKWEEGAFVDRERASAIWRGSIVNAAPQARRDMRDEIIWVPGPWRDPALLEWQRGGRFELRIFPIPKQGSRRIRLAYTQMLPPSGGLRRYTYPLAHDPGGSTRVDDFALDLQVRGHDSAVGVTPQGYAMNREGSEPGAERLTFQSNGFVPAGDLTVEYALPDRRAEMSSWAYRPSDPGAGSSIPRDQSYVALALRPQLPRAEERQPRSVVLVVDSSRSMFGETYQRATRLASRLVAELDETDHVTVLACDTECRGLPGGFVGPGTSAARDVSRFLEGVTPEGASDPTAAVRSGVTMATGEKGRALRVVYIGDGTPTVGPTRPSTVTSEVRSLMATSQASLTAIAVGAESDLTTLRAMARGGGGVVLPYAPGQTVTEAVYGAVGALSGNALRDVQITLPSGLVAVAPERLDTVPAGGEAIVVARLAEDTVDGTVVLRGKVGSKDFEQRYPLKVLATSSTGNAFVPRLYAATRIADLEQRGDAAAKAEAIKLSSQFNIASRYTSLLVLESTAMFQAFGLDNSRRTPEWSGEESLTTANAQGEVDYGAGDREQSAASGGGGMRLGASAAEIAPRRSAAKRDNSAPPSGGFASESAPSEDLAAGPQGAWPSAAQAPMPAAQSLPPKPKEAVAWEPLARERTVMRPMRRVWDRKGEVLTKSTVPSLAASEKIAEAERSMADNPNRRGAVKRLYALYAMAGDLPRAADLARRWSEKEPLDVEALTARADLAARAGDRDLAIRILGSVVDVRPDDVRAQERLARLHRWAGRPALGCRHSVAIAEIRGKDAKLLEEAVRCSRNAGADLLANQLLGEAELPVAEAVRSLLSHSQVDAHLEGDLKLKAQWSGGADLDLALIDPDGSRISWLGAPTRAVITATDVVSSEREGLALRGAKPGEYVVEIVRGGGSASASGTLDIEVAGNRRSIPFSLEGGRVTLAIAKITMTPRLVPAW